MKAVLIIAIALLVAAGVNAQPGMPQVLSCTEQAFNFSVSVGTKWKLSTPQMGPVETRGYETDYAPAWTIKLNQAAPETDLLPLFQARSNAMGLSYSNGQRNYGQLFYPKRFGIENNAVFNYLSFSSIPISATQLFLRSFKFN